MSFTILDWRIGEQILSSKTNFNIWDVEDEQRLKLCFNIWPQGLSLLHMISMQKNANRRLSNNKNSGAKLMLTGDYIAAC